MAQTLTRSVIPIGTGGLAICLPIKWMRKQGLKEKDKVVIEIADSTITVRAWKDQ